ncbi:homeobox-leucine zipper protein HOX3-like [Magnolia sinica]|uniref:homeobox-leucine zipper protein HOX3-like n=1 Tax=Magnolia sinica TaxID=86752 RepID=UPI0026595F89|nr:homeobox-leucine zipper protein HOX3-like [Magnolia sinica]
MAILPSSSSSLELTMAPPSSDGGCCMRDLDINQLPSGSEAWPIGVIDDDEENGPPRKKLRLTKEQSRLLEETFRENQTLNPKEKEALAFELKLKPRQVEVWFQNRRARTKLKQTEMECEYLKRCFGSLTEENRRLQREVEELRAMKVAPPTVFSPHTCEALPASTLTMCPRCERVTSSALHRVPNKALTKSTAMHARQRQPSAAC